jgi:hypothetical protein
MDCGSAGSTSARNSPRRRFSAGAALPWSMDLTGIERIERQ